MIKVRQDMSTLSTLENKEIEKLKNDLKNDFKYLFDVKLKLENENSKLHELIKKLKQEYQKLNNENEENKKYITSYEDYSEGLVNQIKDLNSKINELENQHFYYEEPMPKRRRYIPKQTGAIDDDNYDENYVIDNNINDYNNVQKNNHPSVNNRQQTSAQTVAAQPPKKNTKKVGLSNHIKQ